MESIANKFGVSQIKLKTFHNTHCDLKDLIGGNELPKHLKEILLKEEWKVEERLELSNITTNLIDFENSVKYRTEQFNTTKIEEDVKSYSHLKKEYDVSYALKKKILKVKMVDFFYEFNPPALSKIFDFTSVIDYIRNNCTIQIDDLGRFKKIVNKEEQKENWDNLKISDLQEIEFIKVIRETKPDEYNKLLTQGDFQFSSKYDDKRDYDRDLFYLTILDKYLFFDNLPEEKYTYQSQLFPTLEVPMKVRYDILKTEGNQVTIRKVMETLMSEGLLKELENKYNEYHKPLIKYKFSSYKLDIRNKFTYNIENRVLESAELAIIENIENNLKSECFFNVKKV